MYSNPMLPRSFLGSMAVPLNCQESTVQVRIADGQIMGMLGKLTSGLGTRRPSLCPMGGARNTKLMEEHAWNHPGHPRF